MNEPFVDLTHYLALTDCEHPDEQDQALRSETARALSRLRLPGIDTDGCLEEWGPEYHGSELGHRHLSHLYGVYPGTRLTARTHPD